MNTSKILTAFIIILFFVLLTLLTVLFVNRNKERPIPATVTPAVTSIPQNNSGESIMNEESIVAPSEIPTPLKRL